MNRAGILLTLGLFLGLAGCVTEPRPEYRLTGDAIADGEHFIDFGPARDKVLWQYRTSLAAMRRGEFDTAKRHLDAALARISNIFGQDKDAKKSRSVFEAEARKTFIGEPYERVMAWYYRGILYWMDGEPDNARACFRSGQLADSDAEKHTYACDYVLLDYLDGYASVKLGGDGAPAIHRAEASAKQWKPPNFATNANLLVFVDYGAGPEKFATGSYGEQLRFRPRPSPVRGAMVKLHQAAGKAVPYDDLLFQAMTRGGRVMDHVLANKAVFKSSTDAAGNALLVSGAVLATGHDTGAAGLAVMGAGLVSKIFSSAANPEADTRTWDNLPQFLSFVAFEAPPGEHTLTVDFMDDAGRVLAGQSRTVHFTITAGRDKVIYVSDKSTTPLNL